MTYCMRSVGQNVWCRSPAGICINENDGRSPTDTTKTDKYDDRKHRRSLKGVKSLTWRTRPSPPGGFSVFPRAQRADTFLSGAPIILSQSIASGLGTAKRYRQGQGQEYTASGPRRIDQSISVTNLGELLFAQRTLGVVVQTSLQTLETKRVAARRCYRLVEKSEKSNVIMFLAQFCNLLEKIT